MATADIFKAVLACDEAQAKSLTQADIDAGTDIETILNDGLISAMDDVGKKFSEGDLFVPEMLMAANTIIGGAPVTQAYADQIGAAGYSDDAPGAVELAHSLQAA